MHLTCVSMYLLQDEGEVLFISGYIWLIHNLNMKQCSKNKPMQELMVNFVEWSNTVKRVYFSMKKQSKPHCYHSIQPKTPKSIQSSYSLRLTEANSFFGYMFELFTEACFVMQSRNMLENVVRIPNKLQFLKQQAQSSNSCR